MEISQQGYRPRGIHLPVCAGDRYQYQQFPFRVLKEARKKARVAGVTHQMLRRTCSTYMAQITSVKDVQAHLRHTNAKTTLEHYIKSVPERAFASLSNRSIIC